MSIIDTLITNRTRGDYYNITDLNRVGQAMRYVAARLRACGFDVVVTPRTDWVWTDRATPAAAVPEQPAEDPQGTCAVREHAERTERQAAVHG